MVARAAIATAALAPLPPPRRQTRHPGQSSRQFQPLESPTTPRCDDRLNSGSSARAVLRPNSGWAHSRTELEDQVAGEACRKRHPPALGSPVCSRTPWPPPIASPSAVVLSRSLATSARPRSVDRSDRGPFGPLGSDREGLLLRPDRGEGPDGQGPISGRVPGLRRVYAAAEWQGRRLRVLQGLPPGGHRAPLDARAGTRCDARVAIALREVAVVLRLVVHPRPPARGRSTRAAGPGRLARVERRLPPVRDVGCRPGGWHHGET